MDGSLPYIGNSLCIRYLITDQIHQYNTQQQTRAQSLSKKSDSEELKQRQLSGPHLVSAQHNIGDKKKTSGHWSQSPVKTGFFINHCYTTFGERNQRNLRLRIYKKKL